MCSISSGRADSAAQQQLQRRVGPGGSWQTTMVNKRKESRSGTMRGSSGGRTWTGTGVRIRLIRSRRRIGDDNGAGSSAPTALLIPLSVLAWVTVR